MRPLWKYLAIVLIVLAGIGLGRMTAEAITDWELARTATILQSHGVNDPPGYTKGASLPNMIGPVRPICGADEVAVQTGVAGSGSSATPIFTCYTKAEIDCYQLTAQLKDGPGMSDVPALGLLEYVVNHAILWDYCSAAKASRDHQSVDVGLVKGQQGVTVELNGPDTAGIDFDLWVTGANGQYITGDYSGDSDEAVSLNVPETGRYTAHVYSWAGKGPYDVRVTLPDAVLANSKKLNQWEWSWKWVSVDALQPSIILNGPKSGDFDLYVCDFNGYFVAGSWSTSSTEQVRNFTNYCGTFMVGVHAYRGSGEFVLTCNTRWNPSP